MDPQNDRPSFEIHFVSSIDSPEFSQLTHTLTRSNLIALDAEWKPFQIPNQHSSFPRVSILQIACQFNSGERNDSVVFLLDLLSIPLSPVSDLLTDVFVSPHVLKLGFRFKQDLVYLSTTFSSYGGVSGLDRVSVLTLDCNYFFRLLIQYSKFSPWICFCRLNLLWILRAYTIIFNISKMEGRCISKLRVSRLSAMKYWESLFRRSGHCTAICYLFNVN